VNKSLPDMFVLMPLLQTRNMLLLPVVMSKMPGSLHRHSGTPPAKTNANIPKDQNKEVS